MSYENYISVRLGEKKKFFKKERQDRNYYKGHGQNQGGGWRWGREVGSPGVGWRDGEKRHTTVIE